MRTRLAVLITLILTVLAYAAGAASDRDEAVLTVQVGSADHEIQEGYFSLGESATVMVKPGSPLFNFLVRQRGRTVKVVVSEATTPGLSRLER